ncbi:hypothetical protein Acsp03_17780 [Actinomadura sp. NBRC 104412]|uniref:Eco57I restriction-modification methylase domain-containing protein n=1 Tax=Actinomadura sp. NBRC 104412 TaxID=3032203 RepID=UPI0024A19C78|nr:type IIL restriction-modification enzyme MmeI [Actinomadura sp. NBRC 104412]GLZ04312.1 hypothetical protein Acsp03_17780 [Actinomadura sp. NBRC 104412]
MARVPRRRDGFDHTRWLELIEFSGPFLSLPVIRRTWPTLETIDTRTRERLRLEHTELPGRSWCDWVLRDLLGWDDLVRFDGASLAIEVPEHQTTIEPSFVLRDPGTEDELDTKAIRLLGLISDDAPTRRIKGSIWPATPVDRLARLCRHHDVPLGLATDGRWFVLVWAPRERPTATAMFDSLGWHEAAERDVVRAFMSLLGRSRFFAVPEDETLPRLFEASADNGEEITEALGVQVRQAVELLVAAIGRAHTADKDRDGPGIGDVKAHDVYRGAVTVLMRIIFILYAEERRLLPSDKVLYRTAYSAGLLCTELERRARIGSEEDLEHTYDGWHRLLALFNAVHDGVDHPDMRMRGQDGSIFQADRFPWLPHEIDDRTILHILQAVQYVETGTGKSRERRKLSFRTLDVEQIGYVYEGLLSYSGFHAEETYVGLVGKAGHEAEVPLSKLEEFAASASDVQSLSDRLAVEFKDSRIGSPKALEKRLAPLKDADKQEARRKLLAVTRGDYPLTERLLPFFNLIRRDLRNLPVVILTDELFVTESPLRKNTGTHYTPRNLAEKVVEGALEPLVYSPGPLQTADRNEWKPRSSAEILSLKVADIAMGSGAFLVAACRYLANHLVNAWLVEGDERATGHRAESIDPQTDADLDPVVINARRHIIENCLYGVDINDMAVEMAKLSLWLISMDPNRPFAFLDDRLICGDSLLGITSLDQLEVMHMDAERGRQLHSDERALFDLSAPIRDLVHRLRGMLPTIAAMRRDLSRVDGTDLAKLEAKRKRLAEIEQETEAARFLANLTVGAALHYAKQGRTGLDRASGHAVQAAAQWMSDGGSSAREKLARWVRTDLPHEESLSLRRLVHWPLAFPEVFHKGGFDAIFGNPPFLGGTKLGPAVGQAYRDYLVKYIGRGVRGTRGTADLVAYFLLRIVALLGDSGQTGILATNTLAQGDSRRVGLDQIVSDDAVIRRAIKSEPWPSRSAVLEFCAVWISRATLGKNSIFQLGRIVVPGITPSLDGLSRVSGNPYRLATNFGMCIHGTKIWGRGFTLTPSEAKELIAEDARNGDVLQPYLIGQDVNARPDCSASRWVINFHDWSEGRAKGYGRCYDQVTRLVKPERSLVSYSQRARDVWWQFEARRPELLLALTGLDEVIVIALVSKTVMPVTVPTGQVFSHMLAVFPTEDRSKLALLSSAHHYWWALSRASSMKADLRYTPSDVFETLPLPAMTPEMRELGQRLDEFRRGFMLARQAGLTKTYNMVHDPNCTDWGVVELRDIHRRIDEAVCRAYQWDDLIPQLDHGHHRVGRETRYTVGPAVQRELVDRLLELNHERYAAEVAAGLHDKKRKGRP